MTVYAITDTKKGRTGIAPTYLQTTRQLYAKNLLEGNSFSRRASLSINSSVEERTLYFEFHVANKIARHKRNRKCFEGHKSLCAERFIMY